MRNPICPGHSHSLLRNPWALTVVQRSHQLEHPLFFYAWGLPPDEHYSKRPNHGQERSWRAEVESKKKYIQQIVYEPILVSTWALTRNIWVQCTALFGTRGQMVT